MNIHAIPLRRRGVLLTPLVAGIGWLAGSLARPAAAQEKATLIAKRVDRVPNDPEDGLWQKSEALDVPMAPQAVVKPRTYEAGVKAIKARALYDENKLAFLLEWGDSERDATIGGVVSFRDAIAVQFPADSGSEIPYFGMGETNKPVTIYHWKADWEFARDHDVDEEFPNMAVDWYPFSGRGPGEIAEAVDYAKEGADKAFHTSWWSGSTLGNPEMQARTPVEKLEAEGFGTITSVTPDRQDGLGKGVWKDGVWKVVISFPRAQERFAFERGKTIPVAFAAWDGARKERGGEKAVSTWYFLGLEEPIGAFSYVSPILMVAGAGLAQIAGLRYLRRRARRNREGHP